MQCINLDIVRLEQRRKDDDAGVRRLPKFLITLVAHLTVRNIAGSGTAAPLRGMFLLIALVALPGGTGTTAPMRGMFLLITLVARPAVRNIAGTVSWS